MFGLIRQAVHEGDPEQALQVFESYFDQLTTMEKEQWTTYIKQSNIRPLKRSASQMVELYQKPYGNGLPIIFTMGGRKLKYLESVRLSRAMKPIRITGLHAFGEVGSSRTIRTLLRSLSDKTLTDWFEIEETENDNAIIEHILESETNIAPAFFCIESQSINTQNLVQILTKTSFTESKTLILNNCHIKEESSEAITHITQSKKLQHLSISRIQNPDEFWAYESTSRIKLQALHLDLTACSIDQYKIEKILQIPIIGPWNQTINLSKNPLGDKGAETIINTNKISHMKEISLHHCNITTKGAIRIAEHARINPNTIIGISLNPIQKDTLNQLLTITPNLR